MKCTLLVAILALGATVLLPTLEAMRTQGVSVRGRLLCAGKPLAGAKVRTVDVDSGPDPDDTLDEKTTDADGKFELSGTTIELTPIDPLLYIWHDCNDEQTPCLRKVTLTIPKSKIHGKEVTEENWINIGELNLEGEYANEKRECIH